MRTRAEIGAVIGSAAALAAAVLWPGVALSVGVLCVREVLAVLTAGAVA